MEQLCTASNKAFLCISSHIVIFFLIEQSYVAKTSCKMECKTPEVFMVTYQFTPVDKTTKIFCFHRVGVDIFSVLAA